MSYDHGMSLLLPGERPLRTLEVFLAIAAVVGLCALGCATPTARSRHVPPSVFEAARFESNGPPPPLETGVDESAAFVERALHDAGLRFGTDGTAGALWGYLRESHQVVPAAAARKGDIVFFDTRGLGTERRCADHAGIVESAASDGRIVFIEARGGRVRRSFVDPVHPTDRRSSRGEILNTFLRPKSIDDPDGTRYFAGEMLCGIARAVPRR